MRAAGRLQLISAAKFDRVNTFAYDFRSMTRKELARLREAHSAVLKLVRSMVLTVSPLNSDLRFASNCWENDKSNQFWRRTVIRCLLALLEAVLWNMKNIAPKIASVSEIQLSNKELDFAEDRIWPFPKFRTNLAKSFELFAKVHGLQYSLNCDAGFDALCLTYELRNRIMHPKTPFDPDVSEKNINDAMLGSKWFSGEFDHLMRLCDSETDKIVADAMRRIR